MNPTTQLRPAPLPGVPARGRTSLPADLHGPASPAATQLGFALFVLVNLLLYVRPMEYLGDFLGQRAYLVLILACFLVSFPAILAQFDPRWLGSRPLITLVLLLWPVMVVSNLAHGQVEDAADGFVEFAKTLLYYLLLVGLVTTPKRLRTMLFWLPLFLAFVAVLAILEGNGLIHIDQLKPLEEANSTRLRATGLFGDPNDLGVVLVVAIVCCLHCMFAPRLGPHSIIWLALLGLFLYTLHLTRSRGAVLALGGALFVLIRARLGTLVAVGLGVFSMPGVILFTGRAVDLHARQDTATSRFQLWSDALSAFNQSPVFGVGYDNLRTTIHMVAHNSYLHAFAELGFVGGCLFLGLFVWALWTLVALPAGKRVIVDPELRALHPTMTALVAGYMVGMCSLSLCYVIPTYTVLGLAAAYLNMTVTSPPYPRPRLNDRFFLWLALLGVIFWCVLKVALQILPH